MTCESCAAAQLNPLSGLYHTGCLDCTARLLAQSPGFAASMAALKFRRDYLEALKAAWGAKWEDGHRLVKHHANRIQDARTSQQVPLC